MNDLENYMDNNFNFNEEKERQTSFTGQRPVLDTRSDSFKSASSLGARLNGFSIPASAKKAVAAGIAKGLN